jgi:hypothetical protein
MNIHTGAKKSSTRRVLNKIPKKRGPKQKLLTPEEIAKETPIPKKTVYNVFRSIMTEQKAGLLAGYQPGTKPVCLNDNEGTVSEIRERVQNDPKLGFLTQLNFYAKMRDDENVESPSRVAAAKQLDTVAGYNAPQKVEIDNRHALLAAVRVVHQVTGNMGMSPMQLKGEIKRLSETQELIEEGVGV